MVKITIKTLDQKVFHLEMDLERTVADLKSEIEKTTNKSMPADQQTLIYCGVILDSSHQISHYQIDEKKFIVVMLRKPVNRTKESAPNERQEQAKVADQVEAKNSVTSDSMTNPDEIQRAIENIVEMGYPREDVLRAFRASFNNPDRAVEYLINGIPNYCLQNEAEASVEANVVDPVVNTTSTTSARDRTPLTFLRTNERFRQMRRIIQANPDMLNTVISQIGEANPELLQVISENQEEFVRLLNEREDEGNESDASGLDQLLGGEVVLTPEDRAAIDRLKALGFPEGLVVQTYFACDRNEEQAANILLLEQED